MISCATLGQHIYACYRSLDRFILRRSHNFHRRFIQDASAGPWRCICTTSCPYILPDSGLDSWSDRDQFDSSSPIPDIRHGCVLASPNFEARTKCRERARGLHSSGRPGKCRDRRAIKLSARLVRARSLVHALLTEGTEEKRRKYVVDRRERWETSAAKEFRG